MTDRLLRPVTASELRAADALFRRSLHVRPPGDGDWSRVEAAYQPGRTWGAFEDEVLVGTARSVDAEFTVPGGARVPLAAVTGVGVRADRTRRGILRDLMRTQLREFAERGVPCAALHASEAAIYGRFGYGVGTVARTVRLDRARARLHPAAPSGGELELVDFADLPDRLPAVYPAFASGRPGMMTRPAPLWVPWEGHYRRSDGVAQAVLHHGPDGVDGYASYRVHGFSGDAPAVLHVEDMATTTDTALAELLRFLLGVDLVGEVVLHSRPTDEPVELMLTDPRAASVSSSGDDLWVRLVDLPRALAARELPGADRVVLEVDDPVLPGNAGRWSVSRDGVIRTDEPTQVRAGVDAVAMMYLGTWRASALAAAGRLDVDDPAAVGALDRLFSARVQPWCGTFF